ncbi:MAG: carboxypeptidase-like regulatory domain-containing protein, partial [Bacteroidota bacterium]
HQNTRTPEHQNIFQFQELNIKQHFKNKITLSMKRNIFLNLVIILLSFPAFCQAQQQITGRVLEAKTNEPVSFATVYLNGTTVGTTTDDDGSFLLNKVTYPCQLVVSHISYKTLFVDINQAQGAPLKILIEPNAVDLQSVQVEDKSLRGRNEAEFAQAFVGIDYFGERAKLTNPEVLFFTREKEKTRAGYMRSKNLKATAKQALIIEQPELGYKIHADLAYFQVDYGSFLGKNGASFFQCYYFFEPYQTDKKHKQKKWERQRSAAYYHSSMHFMRSLYQQDLAGNGYRLCERVEDKEKGIVTYQDFPIGKYIEILPDSTMQVAGLKDQRLYIFYYPKNAKREPLDITTKIRGQFEQSVIQFSSDKAIIRSNGTTPGLDIQFGGVIAEKKVGAHLPDDFVPVGL